MDAITTLMDCTVTKCTESKNKIISTQTSLIDSNPIGNQSYDKILNLLSVKDVEKGIIFGIGSIEKEAEKVLSKLDVHLDSLIIAPKPYSDSDKIINDFQIFEHNALIYPTVHMNPFKKR